MDENEARIDDDGVDDLYSDLENIIFARSDDGQVGKKKEQVSAADVGRAAELQSLLTDAYEENVKLTMKLRKLTEAHKLVLESVSSFYDTVRLQTSQKNQVLVTLDNKLQEFRNSLSAAAATTAEEWEAIDKLTSDYMTSEPDYSFSELCQQALQTLEDDEDYCKMDSESKESDDWTNKFSHRNVSYYFYAHHEPTVHHEPIEIQYIETIDIGSDEYESSS